MTARTMDNVSQDSTDLADMQEGDRVSIGALGYDVMGPVRQGWVAVRPHGRCDGPIAVAALAEIDGVVMRLVERDGGYSNYISTDYFALRRLTSDDPDEGAHAAPPIDSGRPERIRAARETSGVALRSETDG